MRWPVISTVSVTCTGDRLVVSENSAVVPAGVGRRTVAHPPDEHARAGGHPEDREDVEPAVVEVRQQYGDAEHDGEHREDRGRLETRQRWRRRRGEVLVLARPAAVVVVLLVLLVARIA